MQKTKRSIIVLILAGAFTIVVGRSFSARSNIVEAEWFLLKDKDGVTRANLGMHSDDVAALAFFDKAENCRLTIRVAADGTPELTFFGRDKQNTIQLGHRESDDRPVLGFRDEENNSRLELGLKGDGTPLIALGNKGWADDARLGMRADGSSFLGFSTGKDLRLELGVLRDGTSSVGLFDAGRNGSRSLELSVNPKRPPKVEINDKSRRIELPLRTSN